MEIKDVIARRSDLGSFLVHLTRNQNSEDGATRLEAILRSRNIEARTPFGCAAQRMKANNLSTDSQKCVCFTEMPLQYVHLMIEEIEGRIWRFSPYGVAISRNIGRQKAVNPIWYLDITPGHDWLNRNFENMVDAAIANDNFLNSDLSKLTPFIEQMGSGPRATGGGYRKEFWWEREWRYVGNFDLPERLIVLCPEDDFERMNGICGDSFFSVAFIDPSWGLEQIIGRLAGFQKNEIEII